MADTNFVNGTGVVPDWLNDVNDHVYAPIQAAPRRRNRNGDMSVQQRLPGASVVGTGYIVDGWKFVSVGSVTAEIGGSTEVPAGESFEASHLVLVNTPNALPAAADFVGLFTHLEGSTIAGFFGKPFTLSFWVRSPKVGVHCVAFRNGSFNRSYVAEYMVSAANIWEYKSITLPTGIDAVGTWAKGASLGMEISFCLSSGSVHYGTVNTWTASGAHCTANQVNVTDTTSNAFLLTGVQIEAGLVPTPYDFLDPAVELFRNQRYLSKSYQYSTPVGAVNNEKSPAVLTTTSTTLGTCHVRFPAEMRTTPTMLYIGASGTAGKYGPLNSFADTGDISVGHISAAGFHQVAVTGAAPGNQYQFHWMASAEF